MSYACGSSAGGTRFGRRNAMVDLQIISKSVNEGFRDG